MSRRTFIGLTAILGAFAITSATTAPASATPVVPGAAVTIMTTGRLTSYPLRCRVTANNVNYRRGPGKRYGSFGQLN